MKQKLLSLLLAVTLASCAKYMDNPQNGAGDSALIADSLMKIQIKSIAKEKLPGVWVRSLATQKGEEGFNLMADGKLTLVNFYTMHGDHWQLQGDTIYQYKYTDQDTIPKPSLAVIKQLSDSSLVIAPLGSPNGYSETYHRKTINLSKRYTDVYHQMFVGKLQPFQKIDHSFELTTLLKGVITLTNESGRVLFTLKKDGIKITEQPVKGLLADFPPGKYILTVFYPNPKPKATTSDTEPYTVEVAEQQ